MPRQRVTSAGVDIHATIDRLNGVIAARLIRGVKPAATTQRT
jgi:hypothetical protein